MDEHCEIASKQNFLAYINLCYKNEYEFGNGIDCFNFINREFGFENLQSAKENEQIRELSMSCYSATTTGLPEQDYDHVPCTTKDEKDDGGSSKKRVDLLKEIPFVNNEIKVETCNLQTGLNKLIFQDIQDFTNLDSIEIVLDDCKDEETQHKINGFSCNICQEDFSTNVERTIHANSHLEKHVCPFCAKTFSQKYDLLNHCTLHLTTKSTNAHEKPKGTENEYIEKANKQLQCTVCLKRFQTKYNLRRHLKNIHVPGKCDVCGDVFSQKEDLEKHILTHAQTNDSGVIRKNLQCHICFKIFARTSTVKKHLQNIHYNSKTIPVEEHLDLKDELLDTVAVIHGKEFSESFETKCTPKRHVQRVHHKESLVDEEWIKLKKCPMCFKIFNNASHVKRHIKIIHNNQKNFTCEVCQKHFASDYHLKRHLTVHTGIKKYKCDICLKLFSTNHHLQRHVRVHPGTDFQCYICSKGFTDRINLSIHLQQHLKNVKCHYCQKIFRRNSDLQLHIKRTHQKSVKCDLCRWVFGTTNHLKRHMKVHLKEKTQNR